MEKHRGVAVDFLSLFVVLKNNENSHVDRNDRKIQKPKTFSKKLIVFGGTVFVHLYGAKNPSKKALSVLEKVLTKLF